MAFNECVKLTFIGESAFEWLFQLKIAGERKLLYSETISQSEIEGDENINLNSITRKNTNILHTVLTRKNQIQLNWINF